MTDTRNEWTEEDSKLYREIAAVAVPAREEQIATILTLLPFGQQDSFQAVELGCGEGALAFALLDCFPNASVVALDGSPAMLGHATECLSCFGRRAKVTLFDLASKEWLSQLQPAESQQPVDCVVSSLCLHHLPGGHKQSLFAEIYRRLSERGALLIADLVEPQRVEAQALFASVWDHLTETQSRSKTGSVRLFEKFIEEKWNYYRFPDPRDQPSSLFDQLTWLRAAGFAAVDCFWLQAGHAVYGGYKARMGAPEARMGAPGQGELFAAALRSAQAALRVTSRRDTVQVA